MDMLVIIRSIPEVLQIAYIAGLLLPSHKQFGALKHSCCFYMLLHKFIFTQQAHIFQSVQYKIQPLYPAVLLQLINRCFYN